MVFVATDAIPPGFADIQVPGVEWVSTHTQEEILDALAEKGEASARELAEELDVTKETVRRTLKDVDGVDRRKGIGAFGADLYGILAEDIDVLRSGDVDLVPEEIANEDVIGSSTWSLAIRAPTMPAAAGHARSSSPSRSTPPETTERSEDQHGIGSFNGGDPASHGFD